MAATATLYPTTVASTTGTTWATTANATGSTTGTPATWTNSTANAVGTIQLSGYAVQTAIGTQPASIQSVQLTLRSWENTTARFTSVTAGLYSGSATLIGTAQTVTLSTATTNTQTITFPVAPTWAQLADMQIRVTATHANNTQSAVLSVDTVGAVVNYTPATQTITATATLVPSGTMTTAAPTVAKVAATTLAGAASLTFRADNTAYPGTTIYPDPTRDIATAPVVVVRTGATATLTGVGVMTAAGTRDAASGSVTLAGGSSVSTAPASVQQVGAVLAGAGLLLGPLETTLHGASFIQAGPTYPGTDIHPSSLRYPLPADAVVVTFGVALAGGGSLTAVAAVGQAVAATLAGAATTTSTATLGVAAATALAGTGTVAAAGTASRAVAATLAGGGALTAAPTLGHAGSIALAGAATAAAVVFLDAYGAAGLTGESDLAASGGIAGATAVDLDGSGQLDPIDAVTLTTYASAELVADSTLAASAGVVVPAIAVLAGVGGVGSDPIGIRPAAAALVGSSELVDVLDVWRLAEAILAGAGAVASAATTAATTPASVAVEGGSAVSAAAFTIQHVGAALTGATVLTAVTVRIDMWEPVYAGPLDPGGNALHAGMPYVAATVRPGQPVLI